MVYGGPGSLKSALVADAAVCIAAGRPWLETLPVDEAVQGVSFATRQAPVFWLDFDNGIRRTDERFAAFARVRHLSAEAPFYYVSMPSPWLNASQRAAVEALADLLLHYQAQFVVIDNLGLITGDVDENSANMAHVMGDLRWLCEETQSAVVLIHHQRKTNGSNARLGETLRGHSSIEAALDLALLVERKPGTESVAVIPTKVRGYHATHLFGAQFTYTHVAGTYDLATARFFAEQVETAKEKERRLIRFTVTSELRALQGRCNAVTQKRLVEAVRDALSVTQAGALPGVNKVRGILHAMERTGEITVVEGERGMKQYRLPG
jgi:hypothetical protein